MKTLMNSAWFDEVVTPVLKGYSFEYSSFPDGDFGDLDRIELQGFSKMATVEFWSRGWVGLDIYDCALDEQRMNALFSAQEKESAAQAFELFVKLLTCERG